MGNELIELIENIDQSQIVAECDVLSALSDTYQKALMISEQCDNVSIFGDLLFMEAKDDTAYTDENDKKVEAPRPIRSQNIIAKIIRLIKRIWQRILTMISAAATNAAVHKLKSYIKNASTDGVPSPYQASTLKFYIGFHNDLIRIDGQAFEHSPSGLVAHLKSAKAKVERHKKDSENAKNRRYGTMEFVPKELMIEYLDSYQNYLNTLKDIAKSIDKYLDKHYKTDGETVQNHATLTDEDKEQGIVGRFTESKLSEEDIQILNNASTILFEELRVEMGRLRESVQKLSDQFTKTKEPGIELTDSISMEKVKTAARKMLMNVPYKPGTSHAIIVIDTNTTDSDAQRIIARYKDIMYPEPKYGHVIGIFLLNQKKGGSVMNWRVLKSDNVSDDITKELADGGKFYLYMH